VFPIWEELQVSLTELEGLPEILAHHDKVVCGPSLLPSRVRLQAVTRQLSRKLGRRPGSSLILAAGKLDQRRLGRIVGKGLLVRS
jgi:hypothetical protein